MSERALTNPDPRRELGPGDTHQIGSWPANRLIAQSTGRGWRNVYAAIATVNSWSGSLAPIGHPCLAYCVHRPAQLRRQIRGAGRAQAWTVRPRQFFMIPGHETTEWHRHGSSDMLMLYLRRELIEAVARTSLSAATWQLNLDVQAGTVDPLMEQLALSMLGTLQSPEDGSSALYVDGLVHVMAMHLLRRHGGGSKPRPDTAIDTPALRRIPDLIEANLSADLNIAMLAREAGLTPQTFSRSFAKTAGTTVHQYVLRRRVERARHLLSSTDLPIVEIALQTGFASQSHLSTAFKRLTGVTPGHYRAPAAEQRSER